MAQTNTVEIRVTASGAEQAAKILNQVAKEGGQLGAVTASGAKQAEKAMGAFSVTVQQASSLMGQAGINTGIFGQAVGALASPLGIAGAAMSALGLAIHATTDFMTKNYEQMRSLMAVSGLAAEEADALSDTFDLLGLNSEHLAMAMFRMSTQIESGGESFKGLGLDLRDASGQVKTAGQLFLEARDKISSMGSASERNAALLANFGRAGLQLAQVFALSTEEFNKFLQKAGMMGPSAEESMRVTKEYTLATAELSKTWQGFVETAGQLVLPMLSSMTKSMTLAIEEVSSWGQRSEDWFARMGKGLSELSKDWDDYWRARGGQDILPRTAEGESGGIGTSDAARTAAATAAAAAAASAGVSALTKGESDALRKLNDMLTLKNLPQAQQGIETLKRQVNELALAAGYAAPAAQALADTIVRLERGQQAADAMKPLDAALKSLRDSTAMLKLTELQQEFLKLVAPVENVIVSMEKAGTISPKVAAEYRALAAAAAQVGIAHKQADIELKAFVERLNSGIDRTLAQVSQGFDHEADAMRKAAEAEKAYAEGADVMMGATDSTSNAFDQLTAKAKGELVTSLTAAENELKALQATLGQTGPAADVLRDFLAKTGLSMDQLDERTKNFLATLGQVQTGLANIKSAEAFQETLAGIGREAALLGPDFDEAASRLDAFKQRILELQAIKNPTGEILSEIDQLKAKFADTRDFIQWRTMFENVFSSVGDAINTLVQGVILGTQTMGEAFKKLAQAIITQFVNAIIQQALNPLVKAAAGVVAGLFSSGARVASAGGGGGGSSGDIDIGGPSMSVPSIPTGIFDTGTLSNLWSGLTNGWAAFNEGLDAGASTFDALSSSWDTFTTAFGGAASGLSVGLAGVGAAVAAFGTIMDFVNGKTNAAIGGLTGAVVGGVAGGLIGSAFAGIGAPLGALVGAALGDTLGSWLGGMFGGPSNYELKRIQAADEANKALGNLTRGFESALKTFDSAQILGSLQAGGAGGSVRTELVLPAGLATQIGLSGQQIGDQLVTQWSSLTLEQFDKVIAAFRDQPDLIQNIRGSGDVPLLAGGDAEAVAQQIAQGAQALLTAFEAMIAVRDKIRTLAVDLTTAANEVLPPGAADAFAGRVNEFRDRMLAVLSSGLPVAEMQKQMNALEAELRNYTGLVDLYAQNTQLIAKFSGDFVTQTNGAILAIRTSLTAAARAVANAQAAANRAMTPEAELKATTALRDAIVNRYQLEMDMVNKLAASLEAIAAKQGTVQQTLSTASVVELGRGDPKAFNDIYMALADMAMVAPTVAQRLWAVGQGLEHVLASLPVTLKTQIDTGSVTAGADIARILSAQVAPFFTSLADMIKAAADAGDLQGQLALLERQADLIKQVGSALVQAINDWAAAASDAVRKLADVKFADINKNWDDFADASRAAAGVMRDSVNKNWDAFAEASHTAADAMKKDINKNWDDLRDGVTKAADAAIKGEQDKIDAIELATKIRQKAIDTEIKGIEKATQAQQKAIAQQIDALQEQLAAAKEWESAAKSIAAFVLGLKLGDQAPSNPADQLALAQSEFAKAQAAFAAAPTAAGAGEAQKAAQQVLDAAGNVLTRTSPEYQKLFASVVDAMKGLGKTAVEMVPVSSADLEKQTELLRATSVAIGEDAAMRIEALHDESVKLNETAAAQIEVLRGGIQKIKDLLDAELKRIDAARQHDLDLVDAWLKVRDEEIKQGRAYDLSVVDGWLKVREKEIKDGRAYDLGVVRGWLDAQLASIEATRKSTVEGIQDGMIAALRINATEQNRILGLLEGAQREALNEITKGVPLEQFKAKAAADTVAQLEKLNGQIEKFLLGSGHATGLAYVPATGAYKLHQGERVLTREERLAYEGGMATAQTRGSGQTITYAPTVNVSGAGDPELIKAMVEEALRRDRRDFLRELETGAAGARLRS